MDNQPHLLRTQSNYSMYIVQATWCVLHRRNTICVGLCCVMLKGCSLYCDKRSKVSCLLAVQLHCLILMLECPIKFNVSNSSIIITISQLFKKFQGRRKILKDNKMFSSVKVLTRFDNKFKQSLISRQAICMLQWKNYYQAYATQYWHRQYKS